MRVQLLFAAALAAIFSASAEAGTILVSNIFGGGQVLSFDASSGAQGIFAPGHPPTSQSSSIAVRSNGNVLVANYAGEPDGRIYEYSSAGTELGFLGPAHGVITGMALSPDGSILYVNNQWEQDGLDHIEKYNSTTSAYLGDLISPGTHFGLAVAPNGNVITNSYGQMNVYTPTGTLVNQFSGLYFSNHIAVDSAGDIFTSSFINGNAINRCAGCASGSGTNSTLITGSDGFGGMTIGPDGMLYVATTVNNVAAIKKFNATTGADLGVLASSTLLYPYEMVYVGGASSQSATPEPSAWMLLGLGGLLTFVQVRRRA